MSRIYHTVLKHPSNSSMMRLFRNLSAVRVTRILGIFLRSDSEILHFRDEVESDGGCSDEWPERPGNGGRPLAETKEAHDLIKGLEEVVGELGGLTLVEGCFRTVW